MPAGRKPRSDSILGMLRRAAELFPLQEAMMIRHPDCQCVQLKGKGRCYLGWATAYLRRQGEGDIRIAHDRELKGQYVYLTVVARRSSSGQP